MRILAKVGPLVLCRSVMEALETGETFVMTYTSD